MTTSDQAWQVTVDEGGDTTKRKQVESCPTNVDAIKILDYLKPRLPDGDRAVSTYGPVDAPGGMYDLHRLKEPMNEPGEGHEGMGQMKPISIL